MSPAEVFFSKIGDNIFTFSFSIFPNQINFLELSVILRPHHQVNFAVTERKLRIALLKKRKGTLDGIK
jgi:hypothetical protein